MAHKNELKFTFNYSQDIEWKKEQRGGSERASESAQREEEIKEKGMEWVFVEGEEMDLWLMGFWAWAGVTLGFDPNNI